MSSVSVTLQHAAPKSDRPARVLPLPYFRSKEAFDVSVTVYLDLFYKTWALDRADVGPGQLLGSQAW